MCLKKEEWKDQFMNETGNWYNILANKKDPRQLLYELPITPSELASVIS